MAIEPLKRPVAPTRLSRSLEQLRRRMGAPVIGSVEWLAAEWPALLGEALAGASAPISFRDGVLVVEADDAAVADEIRWRAQALCTTVGETRGDLGLRSLSVRVSPRRTR